MDKKELQNLIDRISLTGPGGINKIKKVLKELSQSGGGEGDVTEEELQEALAEKQDTLVSGENIKTINGQPVIGNGDISIPRGETGPQGPAGPQGPEGPQGLQGNTGSSVDYPYELVNNLTTNDATKGLSAAQGVVLDGKVSQLEAKVNNLANTRYYGIFTSSADLPADASENGYAYVGSSTPLAIYEFDGEDWNDTGVTVNSIQGEPGEDGVGFASVATPSTADGTATIILTNGDTITLDLNHNHPQYLKYVMLNSESDMPANPDSTTLYMWPEE